MNTVFTPPGSGMPGDSRKNSDLSLEIMSSASNPITGQLISSHPGAAANDDKLGDAAPIEIKSIETTGGWDAYEVWRRFIKDARARRRPQDPN